MAVACPHLHLLHLQLLHLLEQCLSLEFILQLPPLLFCFHPLQRFPAGCFIFIFIPFLLFLLCGFLLHGAKRIEEISIYNMQPAKPQLVQRSESHRPGPHPDLSTPEQASSQLCGPGLSAHCGSNSCIPGRDLGKHTAQCMAPRRGSMKYLLK